MNEMQAIDQEILFTAIVTILAVTMAIILREFLQGTIYHNLGRLLGSMVLVLWVCCTLHARQVALTQTIAYEMQKLKPPAQGMTALASYREITTPNGYTIVWSTDDAAIRSSRAAYGPMFRAEKRAGGEAGGHRQPYGSSTAGSAGCAWLSGGAGELRSAGQLAGSGPDRTY